MSNHTRQIPLSKVNKLQHRIGSRVWDGVIFNRDGITDPLLTILPNKAGREILEALKLEEIENCSHAPCVCGKIRSFTVEAAQ